MRLIAANQAHFPDIANLVSSAEELFLVYPSGCYPWTVDQLEQLHAVRSDFTVAVVDGQIAAFANLYDIRPQDSAFIGNVIVADACKGKGIGKALVGHMLRLCRQKYHAETRLSVFGFNARALLLYTELGFKPYAVEPRQNLQGDTVALIHMRHATG